MAFTLTEEERRALSTRLMVQPPGSPQSWDERKRINGLPMDVLLLLESLRLLADQGNKVAAFLYEKERQRFGLAPAKHFVVGGEQ